MHDRRLPAHTFWQGFLNWSEILGNQVVSHLNRDNIESNFSVPVIQEHNENALIKSFAMSPHLICFQVSLKIPLGQLLDQVWTQVGPKGMFVLAYRHFKWGLISKH